MWAALIPALWGAIQMGIGASQKSKAKRDAKNSTLPEYPISQLYGDTLGVATNEASYGFSPATINSFNETSTQNLASASNSILQGGGGVNDIAQLYGVDANARKQMGVANDQFKASKLQGFYDQSALMAGQLGTKWRLDYYNRAKDKAIASAAMLAGANTTMQNGFNTFGSGLASLGGLTTYDKIPKSKSSGGTKKQIKEVQDGAQDAGSSDIQNDAVFSNPFLDNGIQVPQYEPINNPFYA
mgnify:CR=1 FL=1